MRKPETSKFNAIAIMGTMRSGSNLLERILIQNPEITHAGELFNRSFIGALNYAKGHPNPKYEKFTVKTRDENSEKFLSEVLQIHQPKIPVFRYFHDHVETALQPILDNRQIAKIILKRHPLESFISLELSQQSEIWLMGRRQNPISNEQKITFAPEKYEKWLEETTQFYEHIAVSLQKSGQPAFEIQYETIKDLGHLQALGEFLGLKDNFRYFFEPLKRQNPKDPKNYLNNPETLENLPAIDWTTPSPSEIKPEPIIPIAYFAKNLDLVYLPLAGTAARAECAALEAANGEILEQISTKGLADKLEANPALTAYTRVIDPTMRLYSIMMAHILGEENGFDRDFLEICEIEFDDHGKARPSACTPPAFAQAGWRRNLVKRFLRDFAVMLRKSLWGSNRDHLISDQYWPQALLIKNLEENFPLTTLIGESFPQSPPFSRLAEYGPIIDPHLKHPFDARELIDNKWDKQIHDLYREDYEAYGFEISEMIPKPEA